MKKILAICGIIALLLTGCFSSGETDDSESIIDDAGREVNVSDIERVVSLAPSNSEIIASLGQIDKLVGRTDFCNYPEEIMEIPSVGNAFEVNYEKILALNPDLVITMGEQDEIVQRLEEMDIDVMVVNPSSIDEVFEGIEKVAQVLEVEEKGDEVVANLKEEKQNILDEVEESGQTVFVLLDSTALYTVGSNTFYDEIIQLTGATNVGSEREGYWEMSQEKLLEVDPDIIIYSWPPEDELTNLPGWQELTAVKDDNIYQIDDDVTSRPGPRIIEGLKEIHDIVN
ncbi:helical backbone metal receptor [Proteinivorax tanatarense]|uniref:Helical backbone metal receptor n=1 Tax=Proteinivorax tanatarense TaxID=1260629 RepID=A0AAU7VI94_9FIRM